MGVKDVVTGHCRHLGQLEGAGSVKERARGGANRDQQNAQEASNKCVSILMSFLMLHLDPSLDFLSFLFWLLNTVIIRYIVGKLMRP